MRLLIVTPTLGRSPWLGETIADVGAILESSGIRHVVVAPAAAMGEIRARYPWVSVVESEPCGVYQAITAGVDASEGWEWMTWINDDDRLLSGFADALHRVRTYSGFADVLYGEVDYVDEGGRLIATMPVARSPQDVAPLLASGQAPFTQQGALISAGLWNRLNGFDLSFRIAADFDFWVRAAASGACFRYVPEKVAAFRVRRGQLSGDVERAEGEIAAVLARRDLKVGAARAWLARFRFRLENLPCIAQRVMRARSLRSRALFQR